MFGLHDQKKRSYWLRQWKVFQLWTLSKRQLLTWYINNLKTLVYSLHRTRSSVSAGSPLKSLPARLAVWCVNRPFSVHKSDRKSIVLIGCSRFRCPLSTIWEYRWKSTRIGRNNLYRGTGDFGFRFGWTSLTLRNKMGCDCVRRNPLSYKLPERDRSSRSKGPGSWWALRYEAHTRTSGVFGFLTRTVPSVDGAESVKILLLLFPAGLLDDWEERSSLRGVLLVVRALADRMTWFHRRKNRD